MTQNNFLNDRQSFLANKIKLDADLVRQRRSFLRSHNALQDPVLNPNPINGVESTSSSGLSGKQTALAGLALQAAPVGSGVKQIGSGALAGSQFGATGALIGAGVGAIGAIAGARSRRKARAREAKAASLRQIAGIEQTAGAQRQAAISNIISGLRSAFLGR